MCPVDVGLYICPVIDGLGINGVGMISVVISVVILGVIMDVVIDE